MLMIMIDNVVKPTINHPQDGHKWLVKATSPYGSWCFKADETPTLAGKTGKTPTVFACKTPKNPCWFLFLVYISTRKTGPTFLVKSLTCFSAAGLLEVLESGKWLLCAFGVTCSEGCPARALAYDVDLHLESLRR